MKTLRILKNDPYLMPYRAAIEGRYSYALAVEQALTGGKKLKDIANNHLYFGLHKTKDGWVFREWLPNATALYLVGDFNNWKIDEQYQAAQLEHGVWELQLPKKAIEHGQLYKMLVVWPGGSGERIPAYANRVVQDERTKIFSAQVWAPEKEYKFKNKRPFCKVSPKGGTEGGLPLFIYECHIGMSGEEEKVATYEEFRTEVLPRIAELGYNCVQFMAIQEHPYYGSFGYHVSNFFAASSRFGTPEELKRLIDDAHGRGMAVIWTWCIRTP